MLAVCTSTCLLLHASYALAVYLPACLMSACVFAVCCLHGVLPVTSYICCSADCECVLYTDQWWNNFFLNPCKVLFLKLRYHMFDNGHYSYLCWHGLKCEYWTWLTIEFELKLICMFDFFFKFEVNIHWTLNNFSLTLKRLGTDIEANHWLKYTEHLHLNFLYFTHWFCISVAYRMNFDN